MNAITAIVLASVAFGGDRAASATDCQPKSPDDVCIERDIYFMPGMQAIMFAPARAGTEPFMGGGVQLAPLHWSHNNDNFGPSQGVLFAEVALLQSSRSDSVLALWDVGLSLSLERNSNRRWMIPYFGATMGAISHESLPDSAFTYPFAGAHLYWHHHLVLNAEGGYHFPFSHVDEVRGPRAQLTARVSMW